MIKSIAIIGAGQMGSGIAHVCALAGYHVQLIDISQDQLSKAKQSIEKNLNRQLGKESITQADKDNALNNLKFNQMIQSIESIDLVIEAIVEDFKIKVILFQDLDQTLPSSTILASNTSSISLTHLAAATKRPDRVIGMNFMNPPPLMPLVEVILAKETSNSTNLAVLQMIEKLRKTPVSSKDSPGFIVNRILMPMINEAIYAVYDKVATPQDIDTAMKLGTNQPMGPLELADFIGLDTCLSIMRVLHQGFADDKYRPCPLLEEHVTAGRLGKKSGHGFYPY
jgi:3-hydroxybutyryl-CoA dehydrogenase